MLPIHTRIERTERLLRRMEQDAPLMAVRVAPLSADHRASAISYAEFLRSQARAELAKLLEERRSSEMTSTDPHPAD